MSYSVLTNSTVILLYIPLMTPPGPHFGGHFTLFNSHQQRVTSRVSKHFFLLSTVSSYTKFDFYASL